MYNTNKLFVLTKKQKTNRFFHYFSRFSTEDFHLGHNIVFFNRPPRRSNDAQSRWFVFYSAKLYRGGRGIRRAITHARHPSHVIVTYKIIILGISENEKNRNIIGYRQAQPRYRNVYWFYCGDVRWRGEEVCERPRPLHF